MVEKLAGKGLPSNAKWNNVVVGEHDSVHLGDYIKPSAGMFPAYRIGQLTDGVILTEGGSYAYTKGHAVKVYCPHEKKPVSAQ